MGMTALVAGTIGVSSAAISYFAQLSNTHTFSSMSVSRQERQHWQSCFAPSMVGSHICSVPPVISKNITDITSEDIRNVEITFSEKAVSAPPKNVTNTTSGDIGRVAITFSEKAVSAPPKNVTNTTSGDIRKALFSRPSYSPLVEASPRIHFLFTVAASISLIALARKIVVELEPIFMMYFTER